MSHKTVAEMNALFNDKSVNDAIWKMLSRALKYDFLLYLFFKFFDISGS